MKSQRELLLALTIAVAILLTGCSMMNGLKEDDGRNFDAAWPDVGGAGACETRGDDPPSARSPPAARPAVMGPVSRSGRGRAPARRREGIESR